VARRRSYQDRLQVRRETQIQHRRRLRNQLLAGFAVMAVIGGVIATIMLWPEAPEKIEMVSTLVSPTSDPLVITGAPTTYKVSYDIEVAATGGERSYHYQELTVQRPFDDKAVYYAGRAPQPSTEFKAITNLGLGASSSTDGPYEIRQLLPNTSTNDPRYDITLDDLINNGFYVRRERREYNGRQCTVFRTGRTVQNEIVGLATAKDYVDICIDDSGIVLEQVSVNSGKFSLRILAQSIETAPTLAGDEFYIVGTPLGNADGAPEMVELDLDAKPVDTFVQLDQAPAGFEHKARYRFRDALSAQESAAGLPEKDTYVDVYLKGTQAIVIQQGKVENEPQNDRTTATKVDVPSLGADAEMVFAVAGPTVYGKTTDTWFVHVFGTLTAKDVQGIASQLH
jgi:hypothetical protein